MTPTSFQEWSPVKELLTMLAQLLSLKSGGNFLPEGSEDTAFIAAEVFKNPLAFGSSNERFLHTVRLLPTLHNVQSKMAQWIETLPSNMDQTVENAISKEQNSNEKGGQPFVPKSSAKASESELLASKAQRLVGEVRITIQTLSTSSFLSNPQPGPLRDVLAKLKHLVDELIEALSQNSMDPHQEGSFTPFKHQAIFQKSQEKKEAIPLSLFQDANTTVFSEKQRMKSSFHPRHLTKTSDFSFFSKPQASKSQPAKTPTSEPSFSSKQAKQQDPIATPKKEDSSQDSLINRSLNEPHTKNSRDTSTPSTPNFPKPPLDRTEENETKLRWNRSSSHLISQLEEETGRRAPDRLPIPICLPNPASGTHQRPLAAAKKKRQKRYFFKDDLQEDDSSTSRE